MRNVKEGKVFLLWRIRQVFSRREGIRSGPLRKGCIFTCRDEQGSMYVTVVGKGELTNILQAIRHGERRAGKYKAV